VGVFCVFLAEITWPWAPTQRAIFWLNFLESRLSSQFLELLIGFLAYLEPKLWLKNQTLVKILLPQTQTLDIYGHNSPAG